MNSVLKGSKITISRSLVSRQSNSQQFIIKTLSASLAVVMTLGLAGCGGGGDSGSSSGSVPNPSTPTLPSNPNTGTGNDDIGNNAGNYELAGDVSGTAKVGQTVALLAKQKNVDEADFYEWKVTSGNSNKVQISANHQPASAFTFLAPGKYTISFVAKKRNAYNQLVTVSSQSYQYAAAAADNSNTVSLKGDRAATSGASVSLFFDTGKALDKNEWSIRQVSGARATIDKQSDSALAQIQLPKTNTDQVLVFEASLNSNPEIKDTAYILLRPMNGSNSPYFCDSPTSGDYCLSTSPLNHHYAYKQNSPVADLLTECVMSYKVNDEGLCTLAYLPFIGQVTTSPTIDDIMARVVVSHDWMGANFERFLREYDKNDDFKRLLRSTTAIVISDNIKPSFYWGGTGTMYLSADYLWMTPEQRDTLSESVDYRSGYGRDFDYTFDYDYEINKQSALYTPDYYPDRESKATRSLNTIALPLASLLYHELAHANDYFSQQTLASTNGYSVQQLAKLAPYELITDNSLSKQLQNSYPLSNQTLAGLAKVWYGGVTPTAAQLSYTGKFVADEFFADKANDDYAFYTTEEDVAMMFEEAMMLTRFGANRYIMVMDTTPVYPTVIRGQKNRVASPAVSTRANFVVSKILPEAAMPVSRALSGVNTTELCKGTTYFEYYNTDCGSLSLNIPHINKYKQLQAARRVDDLGRPIGAPRHQTPKVKLPTDVKLVDAKLIDATLLDAE